MFKPMRFIEPTSQLASLFLAKRLLANSITLYTTPNIWRYNVYTFCLFVHI